MSSCSVGIERNEREQKRICRGGALLAASNLLYLHNCSLLKIQTLHLNKYAKLPQLFLSINQMHALISSSS